MAAKKSSASASSSSSSGAAKRSAAPTKAAAPAKKAKSSAEDKTAAPKSILKKAPAAAPVASSSSKGKAKAKAPATKAKSMPTRKTKSPLVSSKPIQSDDEDESDDEDFEEGSDDDEEEEDDSSAGSALDSDEEADMIKGMTTADESDEDEDEDEDDSSDESDSEGIKRFSDIATMKLPSSKDDAAVRARLAKLEARRKAQPAAQKIDRAVLYVGHLPKHFTETPLRSYLSQFGTITRLRLSRNKKTGASKHYAFVEFADEEVARIVQETMDNYLIMGQLLRVKPLSRDQIHPKMWVGANRTFRKIPAGRRAREQHDGAKSVEGKQRAERKLLERQERKRAALKEAGIDYDFDGYQAKPVAA